MGSATLPDIGKLFQAPKKWTSKHLEALNVQELRHLPAAAIVGDARLPNDDDPLFADLAGDFSEPTRDEILADVAYCGRKFENNKFLGALSDLHLAIESFDSGFPCNMELPSFARGFLSRTHNSKNLRFSYLQIPFHLSCFNIKGSLSCSGAYFRLCENKSSLPLTIFTTGKGPERLSAAQEEVPYLLFQAILAYEQNPALDNYTAFVVSMKGPTFQFIKGCVSRSYLQDLIQRKVPSDPLKLYCSVAYDLLEQGDRKEFVRIFFGLFRYLYDLLEVY